MRTARPVDVTRYGRRQETDLLALHPNLRNSA